VFKIADEGNHSKDRLLWKWLKGPDTSFTDFGAPMTGTTGYSLCVYDESGGNPHLAVAFFAPPRGICPGDRLCWKQIGSSSPKGFKYANKSLTPLGLASISLTAGPAGKARVIVAGKGPNLHLGLPATPGQLFLQDGAVRVQLLKSDDSVTCWEAVYAGAARKNTSTAFNDSTP